MKLLSVEQIRQVDSATIELEPIASHDLMERAAMACVKRLVKLAVPDEHILVICGKGNNGGDGLAICRLLNDLGYDCKALVIDYTTTWSTDAEINFRKLNDKHPGKVIEVRNMEAFKIFCKDDALVVDALLGTGINKAAEGFLAEVIETLNQQFKRIISIDVPSGLFTDKSSADNKYIIHSSLTLTFQFPKLAYLMAQNKLAVPEFEILNIGLHNKAIASQKTTHYYLTKELISSLLKQRSKFSHKGLYGHALLLAGSKGKSGAAIISAKAAMRSGLGLLTVHSTAQTIQALLHHVPECMSSEDTNTDCITELDKPEQYDAIAIGPGIGTAEDTQLVLKKLLQYYSGKLVIDADGLNILSENKTWLTFLPPNTILTPHPKEFERLCGKTYDDFERIETLRQFAIKYGCIVVLKGAHSAIAMPDGNVFFNSSGNAGMAKAGSGDGLTGIILGLLSRGYNAPQAALIGTFIHGYAADMLLKKKSMESILISDVIDQLAKAFKKLEAKS